MLLLISYNYTILEIVEYGFFGAGCNSLPTVTINNWSPWPAFCGGTSESLVPTVIVWMGEEQTRLDRKLASLLNFAEILFDE